MMESTQVLEDTFEDSVEENGLQKGTDSDVMVLHSYYYDSVNGDAK